MKKIKKIAKELIKSNKKVYANITYSNDDTSLINKSIIITGGSSGIGKAIAKKCIDCGAQVLIIAKEEKKLIEVQKELGTKCHILQYDLSNVDENTNLVEQAKKILKTMPNCLVNNAGIYTTTKMVDMTKEEFLNIININLTSVYFLTRAFVREVIKENISANILMMNSERSLFGDTTPYGISKAALKNFTDGLASETLKNNIKVNSIAPGMTASAINNININKNISNETKGGRVILPLEIAEAAKFLLSDLSNCVVGTTIMCNEGNHLL